MITEVCGCHCKGGLYVEFSYVTLGIDPTTK